LKVYGCSFQVAHLLQWHDVKRHWCCQNEAIGCRIGASQDKTKAGHHHIMIARKYEELPPARLMERIGFAPMIGSIAAASIALSAVVLVGRGQLVRMRARSQEQSQVMNYMEVTPSL